MEVTMNIEELISLADFLDKQGEFEEAAKVDEMIAEAAKVWVPVEDKEGKYYIAKDEESVSKEDMEAIKNDPGLQKAREQQDQDKSEQLDYMHKYLASAGYDVFRPGELEEWLKQTGRVKLDEDKWSSTLEVLRDEDMAEEGDKNQLSSASNLFNRLSKVADKLDALGAFEQADMIDSFIKKNAGEVLPDVMDWKEPDPKGERAKRYDTDYHHSLQVREPKGDQERMDLEGRKKHHVENYRTVEDVEKTKKEAAPHSLQTRYSPDLVGVQLGRIGDGVYQCPVTGKIYNFETGYTDMDGEFHPGGSVAAQTPDASGYGIPHRIFDSREQIVNRVNV